MYRDFGLNSMFLQASMLFLLAVAFCVKELIKRYGMLLQIWWIEMAKRSILVKSNILVSRRLFVRSGI